MTLVVEEESTTRREKGGINLFIKWMLIKQVHGEINSMANLVESLLNWIYEEFLAEVDPLSLAQALFNDDVIDTSFMDELSEMALKGCQNDLIGRRLIQCLPYYCSSSQLYKALCETGNHTLVQKLSRIAASLNGRCEGPITVNVLVPRRTLRLFFRDLKRCVYSCKLEKPQTSLRKLAIAYDKKIKLERVSLPRQTLADKLTLILAVELDASIEEEELFIHPLSPEEQLNRSSTINRMKGLVAETSSPLITNMIICTRASIEKALERNFEEGERDLKIALQNACQIDPCIEKVDMYYRIVHFYHRKYEHCPSEEARKSLMTFAEIGIRMLEQEEDIVQFQWRVLFCIRMIFCQLCMSTECRIIPGDLSIAGIEKSRELLAKIDESWEGITNKTMLFYCMAKARLCEVTNDIPTAVYYAKQTEQIALENRSKHLTYIKEYLSFLSSGAKRRLRMTASNRDKTQTLNTESKGTTDKNCYMNDGVTHLWTQMGLGSEGSAGRKCIPSTSCTKCTHKDKKCNPQSYTEKYRHFEGDTTLACSSETVLFDDDLLFGDGLEHNI